MAYVNNLLLLFKLAYYVWFVFNTNCLLPAFHWDWTRWCRFTLLILFGKNPMPLKGKLHHPHGYNTNVISPHMSDGVTAMSLSAGLQHKTSGARDRLQQITPNQKLLHKCEECFEFSSSRIKVKSHKKKSHKTTPTCTTTTTTTTTSFSSSSSFFVFCKSETEMTSQKMFTFRSLFQKNKLLHFKY